MNYVLELNNIVKKYKNFNVLTNVNMHINKGSIYGLIGKNGAGKTTIIRIISSLQEPTSGTYSIYGIRNDDVNIMKSRKRMGGIIEAPSIYLNMTARDNLIEQYKIIGIPSLEGIDELLDLVGLSNTGKKLAKNFSLGMKQRLGIAIALATNPDFLILDEPINGLDPQGIIEIRELILNLNKKKGITILISSHYLDELSKIATHYGFLNEGKIVKEISSEVLNKKMQKRIEIEAKDIKNVARYFEDKKMSYEVVSENKIIVYGNLNLSEIVLELSKEKCIIYSVHENEESLENYYMNLIGGKKND